jgi:hypothetical membrane protein
MFTLNEKNRAIAGGIIWICAVQFFVVQVIVQYQWTTPFSLATNNISDLGNTSCGLYPTAGGAYVCSPWHALMNISFVLQGLIIMAGACLLRPVYGKIRGMSCVFWLLLVTGAGIVGVGVFPEDVNNGAHVVSAGTQFVTSNTAMTVFGIAGYGGLRRRGFALFSIVLGIGGLAATLIFANAGYSFGLGLAGIERAAAYTLPVWLIAAGLFIVRFGFSSRSVVNENPQLGGRPCNPKKL